MRTALTNAFEGMLGKAGDFKDGAISKFGEVIDWVAGMGGSVLNAIGDLTGTLAGKGRDLIQGFLTSAKDGAVVLLNWVFGLPGEIVSQIPNPLGVLYNIGVQIVQGLIDGIKSMIGSLVSAVSGAIQWAKMAVNSQKAQMRTPAAPLMLSNRCPSSPRRRL